MSEYMELFDDPGVEGWDEPSSSCVSSCALIALGLKLMSVKSDDHSFILQRGQVRCACHQWLIHSLQYYYMSANIICRFLSTTNLVSARREDTNLKLILANDAFVLDIGLGILLTEVSEIVMFRFESR